MNANPAKISWVDPTTNTDGSPLASGEVTGYAVGVRSAAGTPGIYPYQAQAPATSTSALLAALTPLLPAGTYVAAVQATTAAGASAWSAESSLFTIAALPSAPIGVAAS